MRHRLVLSALLVVPTLVAGQATDGAHGLLSPDHAVCRAWQHAWAEGGDAAALTGYGTLFATDVHGADRDSRSAAGNRSEVVARPFWDRSWERLALGFDYDGARGPVKWGGAPLSAPVVADLPGPGLRARGEVGVGPFVAAVDLSAYREDVRWRAIAVGVATRPVDVFGGRLAVRSGPGCGGGLVLAGSPWARMYGVELRQGQALRLPIVGETRLGVQLGAMPEGSPGSRWPVFHSMRIELQPHPDWVVGLNRAAMFGGSEASIDVTPSSVAWMFLGVTGAPGKDSSFENQVASVDVRGRIPLAGRPMLLTVEHATDDSGWGFLRAPAIRVASALRISPESGWAGASLTWMDTGGGWYRNSWFEWGWTDQGRLLGNRLGGEGWSLLGSYQREATRVAVDLQAGLASRGARNLFAPALEGRSASGSARLYWLTRDWEVSLSGSADVGRTVAADWAVSILRRFGASAR